MSDPRAQPGASDPLSTDHLLDDIKQRSVRGGALVLVSQGIQYAVDLVSIVVLARLLTPEDFGLIAMVTAVVGFLAIFREAGLSTATIQRKIVSQDQVSALFWANFALSIALIAAIGEVSAQLAGVITTAVGALMGLGYWALVARTLMTPFVLMLAMWVATPWRPGPPRWAEGLRPTDVAAAHDPQSHRGCRGARTLPAPGRSRAASLLLLQGRGAGLRADSSKCN